MYWLNNLFEMWFLINPLPYPFSLCSSCSIEIELQSTLQSLTVFSRGTSLSPFTFHLLIRSFSSLSSLPIETRCGYPTMAHPFPLSLIKFSHFVSISLSKPNCDLCILSHCQFDRLDNDGRMIPFLPSPILLLPPSFPSPLPLTRLIAFSSNL